jgi:WD40 repeat protein
VLISALDGGQFAVWDPESGEQLCSLAGSESPLAAIAGSIAGNRLAIGFLDGSIQVYDVPDRSNLAATDAPRQPLHTITAHFGPVRVLAFAPDAALLASSSADAAIKLWHVPAGNGAGELAGPVGALAFGPDGNLLAAAGEDGVVRLWDAAKRELVLSLPRDGRPLRALAFSANGKILAAAGAGRVVSVWHLSTLRGQLAELGLDW